MNTVIPEDWKVTKLAGSLGAEIEGFKISELSDKDIKCIEGLLAEHMVLFFPGQSPSIDEHVDFGSKFGDLEGHPNLKNPTVNHPKIFELVASNGGVADEWHTDITFQESPALLSVLHMVKCPEVGGDTMWSNLCMAHDELSEPIKDLCGGLTALHDALPHGKPEKMAIHPMVRLHPVTGKKVLYVNEHFTRRIVEMNSTESDVFLNYLTKWIQNPRFTVRYKWKEGTLAMWDNRCTQHFVLNDFEGERVIQRVTVMGDKVEPSSKPHWKPWVREGRKSATSRHDIKLFKFLKDNNKF